MIYESCIWKNILKENIEKLREEEKIINLSNRDTFEAKLEIFLFTNLFIVRKLNESHKLSKEIIEKNISCKSYPKKQYHDDIKKQSLLNYYGFNIDIENQYNLEDEKNDNVCLIDLCNIVIHSFCFFLCYQEESDLLLKYIFLNSDRSLDKKIYKIEINKIVQLIEIVSRDDVVEISLVRDVNKNIIVEKHNHYYIK